MGNCLVKKLQQVVDDEMLCGLEDIILNYDDNYTYPLTILLCSSNGSIPYTDLDVIKNPENFETFDTVTNGASHKVTGPCVVKIHNFRSIVYFEPHVIFNDIIKINTFDRLFSLNLMIENKVNDIKTSANYIYTIGNLNVFSQDVNLQTFLQNNNKFVCGDIVLRCYEQDVNFLASEPYLKTYTNLSVAKNYTKLKKLIISPQNINILLNKNAPSAIGYGSIFYIIGDIANLNGTMVSQLFNKNTNITWSTRDTSKNVLALEKIYLPTGADVDNMLVNQAQCQVRNDINTAAVFEKTIDVYTIDGSSITSASNNAVQTLKNAGYIVIVNGITL